MTRRLLQNSVLVRYAVVGGTNTVITYVIYFVLVLIGVNVLAASAVGHTGLIVSWTEHHAHSARR